jgi:putative ABC transport system permease protein
MLERYGHPAGLSRASMVIRTRLGAANQVASEAAMALRPDAPGLLVAIPPPDPPRMRSVISQSMSALFIALAGVVLLIGTAAIANTTLVAIMERTGEIGLRRAIGASPSYIVAQFLLETVLSGFLAGLIGTSLGVIGVLAAALTLHWTAIIDPRVIALGPAIGAVAGLLAGIFPAWKAGHIAPITALRR